MAYSSKSFPEITESMIEQLTKAVVSEGHVYERTRVRYRLGSGNEKIREIVKVEGLVKGSRHTFAKDADYTLVEGMLEWAAGGAKPDENTTFHVNYTFGSPSPITDANPGSVVRTIVEAIGREMEYLYAQMDYVYRSAFIDTAAGNALDLVVSILGVERRPAQPARGTVVFGRNAPPPDGQAVEETILRGGTSRQPLRQTPVKDILKVTGTVIGAPVTFAKGTDYALDGDGIAWRGGRLPDNNTEFTVSYQTYRDISIPAGTVVSTSTRRGGNAQSFQTEAAGSLRRSPRGGWEVELSVHASSPGPQGNALSGTVTLMPQPVTGVEYVINRGTLTGGSEPETDDELRARAKGELRALGKATYVSLKQQIEGVSGVVRPIKIEEVPLLYSSMGSDGSPAQRSIPGVVRVIVDGGDLEEIRKVAVETKAAGVYVEIARPRQVLLDLDLALELESDANAAAIQDSIESKVDDYVTSLQIGDPVLFGRLISIVLSVSRVKDMRGLTVTAYRDGQLSVTSIRENIVMSPDEKARLRRITVNGGAGTQSGA